MVKRVVNDQVTHYIYNANNRLVRVEDGSGNVIAKYYYDPFGRRLWKEVNGERTYFHYSAQGLIAEYDDQGDPIRFYGYKPGSSWTTDPVFLKKDGEYYFYHNDHLGTPQKLTASNGKVVWAAQYASFGGTQLMKQEISNPLRFPGQYHDEETGLHYNYHRYYDLQLGRYLKTDPIGLNSGDFSLYVYGSNNPLKYIDPYAYEVLDSSMARSLADVESTPSTGLSEIGAGAYYGPGAEFSYSSTTCCEDGKQYKVKLVTACGGVGLAGKGKFSLSATISKITSRKGCPKTRYYFKHENSFGIRSTSIQFDKRNIMLGEINVGMKGLGTIWVFCSDTVISKTEVGCCK